MKFNITNRYTLLSRKRILFRNPTELLRAHEFWKIQYLKKLRIAKWKPCPDFICCDFLAKSALKALLLPILRGYVMNFIISLLVIITIWSILHLVSHLYYYFYFILYNNHICSILPNFIKKIRKLMQKKLLR